MIAIHIDTANKTPLYEQIYTEIKKQILESNLKPGDKLPSTRVLAATLGVSRNTIDSAYYQLLAEGYTETFPKSGFYVSELKLTAPDLSAHAKKRIVENPSLSEKAAPKTAEYSEIRFDFSPFAVDISHFPYSIWKKLSRQILEENKDRFLSGLADGDLELRQAICHYVSSYRGVYCSPEQIIVGAGADYLLQMLTLTFRHLWI